MLAGRSDPALLRSVSALPCKLSLLVRALGRVERMTFTFLDPTQKSAQASQVASCVEGKTNHIALWPALDAVIDGEAREPESGQL